jgi:hypothetical protein
MHWLNRNTFIGNVMIKHPAKPARKDGNSSNSQKYPAQLKTNTGWAGINGHKDDALNNRCVETDELWYR